MSDTTESIDERIDVDGMDDDENHSDGSDEGRLVIDLECDRENVKWYVRGSGVDGKESRGV